MKRLLAASALLTALVLTFHAGVRTIAGQAVASTRVPQGEAISEGLDRIFARWGKSDCPGCVIAIAKDGKPIITRAYGMANLEHAIPLNAGTVLESGSVAKQFTAAAMVILAREGKLSLDDPVRKYLPELPEFEAPITIRHILSHESGLRDVHGLYGLMGQISYNGPFSNETLLELISHQKRLNFTPGTEYLYSNTGFALLTLVAKRITSKTFDEFCQEKMFRPLGMTNTRWRDDYTRIIRNRAAAYDPGPNRTYRISLPYSDIYGNGGLLTTVGDLLIWNESFETGMAEWREVTKQLETPSKFNDGRLSTYGLGLSIGEYHGMREVGHGGATAGFKTYLVRFPDQRISIALLCNAGEANTGKLVHDVADFLRGYVPPPSPASRPIVAAETLDQRAGLYKDFKRDALIRLTVKDGKLLNGFGPQTELVPLGQDRFTNADGTVEYRFQPDSSGGRASLTITPSGEPNGSFLYKPVLAAQVPATSLNEYAGTYFSEELNVTHQVAIVNSRLTVRISPFPAGVMEPTTPDAFLVRGSGYIRFTRGDGGKVDGYEATTTDGRSRFVRFIRQGK